MNASTFVRRALAPLALLLVAGAAQAQGDNPYGIASVWGKRDTITKAFPCTRIAMSAGSWYVIITKLL